MKRLLLFTLSFFMLFGELQLNGQTNMFINGADALNVLKGAYNPADYKASEVISDPDAIRMGIIREVSPENLRNLLEMLETFYNRNSGSDTLSLSIGIGACRSWIKSYFDLIDRNNENRLVTGYLEFDAEICGKTHHKNPFALLPGSDTSNHEIIVIEGHFDTRNEDRCDTQGYTPGIDDNGSGTVLVMELARVMSQYTFQQTILFTTPTGEDQGLFGATAWANYLSDQDIEIRAVLNNDVVGGIYCGKTSSPPSCPYWGHVDSTHVRIFSYSPSNNMFAASKHKQLARYMKYVQDELINPYLDVPMDVMIQLLEDRQGRGGDHTPFRRKGYTAIRVVSANEHGNGSGIAPDRTHTTKDVLGVDNDGDGVLDSLFVNPRYLARNAVMNGVVASLLANAPETMDPVMQKRHAGLDIDLREIPVTYEELLVGIRVYQNRNINFDTLYRVPYTDQITVDLESGLSYYVSIAPVVNGAPGLFTDEYAVNLTGSDYDEPESSFLLHQNFPNPWMEQTTIRVYSPHTNGFQEGRLEFRDLLGRVVSALPVSLNPGENEIEVSDDFSPGIYSYCFSMIGEATMNRLMIKK